MDEDATILDFPAQPPENAREAIGEVLRDERHSQQRTLADVAEQSSVSLPYLSEVERGRKEVSTDLLESITKALELDVADVFERAAKKLRASTRTGAQLSVLTSTLPAREHRVDDSVVDGFSSSQYQCSIGVSSDLFGRTLKVA